MSKKVSKSTGISESYCCEIISTTQFLLDMKKICFVLQYVLVKQHVLVKLISCL